MTEHTAGPWHYEDFTDSYLILDANDTEIATVDDELHYGKATGPANARLIAAAPELLALIEDAVRRWNTDETSTDIMDDFIDAATAAIAHARGQS